MILKVPYYSQIKNTKNAAWKDKSCGIAALKMVLDFYEPTNLSIDELYQKGLDIGGYLENVGWYHHSLALLAKSLGYRAITRSWNIGEESLKSLKERGFLDEDINVMSDQLIEEGIFTLKNEVKRKHPVIVSIPKGFVKNGSGHLVTLVGLTSREFIINDPLDGEKISVDYAKFEEIWTRRAIVLQKKH